MAEKQVDISTHHSKTLNDLQNIKLDVVFTVCGHAHETCPIFPEQAKVIHVGFDDPPKLALNAKTDEEKLQAYRRIRDEIKVFIEEIDSHM
jgi:arsenate reductase